MEKLTEIYSLRVGQTLITEIKKLPPEMVKRLNAELRLTAAKICHEAAFDPKRYLGEAD